MTLIIRRLHELLAIPVIPNTNTEQKPPYPFITYNIISPRINPRGQPIVEQEVVDAEIVEEGSGEPMPIFRYDVKETTIEQPTFVISISIFDNASMGAIELAQNARDIIKHKIYYGLKDINAVVAAIGNIQDRSLLIVDHYEYRYGFDVTIRTTSKSELITETIENINIKLEE